MKKLQEKYKGDKDRLNQEMMKFYRENKINPLASCLPLLAQLPVFISLFYMLRNDLRHDICPEINPAGTPNPKPCGETPASEFFFIPDLTNKATGGVLVALIVLYVGSQLLSTVLSTSAPTTTQRMHHVSRCRCSSCVFVISFPAGLLVYWITTNLWTIVQQYDRAPAARPAASPPHGSDAEKRRRARRPARPAARSCPAAAPPSPPGRSGSPRTKAPARPSAPPPAPPRKKKKRSGRRR